MVMVWIRLIAMRCEGSENGWRIGGSEWEFLCSGSLDVETYYARVKNPCHGAANSPPRRGAIRFGAMPHSRATARTWRGIGGEAGHHPPLDLEVKTLRFQLSMAAVTE